MPQEHGGVVCGRSVFFSGLHTAEELWLTLQEGKLFARPLVYERAPHIQ